MAFIKRTFKGISKGITSVMLAVLTIVVVLAVSLAVGAYLPQLPQTSTNVVGQGGNTQVLCGTGAVSLSDVQFCDGSISGYVSNSGSVALGNITLLLSYTNATHETIYLSMANMESGTLNAGSACCSDLSMLPNDKLFFTFPIGGSNYGALSVTTNCTNPEVSAQGTISSC